MKIASLDAIVLLQLFQWTAGNIRILKFTLKKIVHFRKILLLTGFVGLISCFLLLHILCSELGDEN